MWHTFTDTIHKSSIERTGFITRLYVVAESMPMLYMLQFSWSVLSHWGMLTYLMCPSVKVKRFLLSIRKSVKRNYFVYFHGWYFFFQLIFQCSHESVDFLHHTFLQTDMSVIIQHTGTDTQKKPWLCNGCLYFTLIFP